MVININFDVDVMLFLFSVWSSTAVSGPVKAYSWLARGQSHWPGDRARLTCQGNLFTWYYYYY